MHGAAEAMRARFGGNTAVLLMAPRGYADPALVGGLGLATRDSAPEPVVIIGPGKVFDALAKMPYMAADALKHRRNSRFVKGT